MDVSPFKLIVFGYSFFDLSFHIVFTLRKVCHVFVVDEILKI